MVLIFSHTSSPRLQYTCSFIFKELLGTDFAIVGNRGNYEKTNALKINYSNEKGLADEFSIGVSGLLFEDGIKEQKIECFNAGNYKAFFRTENADHPFDIFSAIFYLLSRYEEYLPHQKDMYGRYAHENSVAFKEKFLQIPLINIWVKQLANALQLKFPSFTIHHSPFTFTPTYDIDIAYSYKHKGFFRSFGGLMKSLFTFDFTHLKQRVRVLSGLAQDPFDTYDQLDKLHQQYRLQPIYFFLLAERNAGYDKNILPDKEAMRQLVKRHALQYELGIHPSWQSGDNHSLIRNEKSYLVGMSHKNVKQSRQHYIRFNLPEGYRRLIDIGLLHDHSMGYGSINGFRASVASSFYWYDLQKEIETTLRIHPFAYMEANSYYEQKLTPKEALEEMLHYYTICKENNGHFISIWHNHMIGSDPLYKGWRETYEEFLNRIA